MRKGFTLLETVLATSVMSLVIVAAMGSWLMFMHKSNRVKEQSFLDMDARKVIESFRTEMRNAARETILFYPENEMPYKAVGFALASDLDGDGLMDMDASGSNILWRQTVVYHVHAGDPPQMRRTAFMNRNNGATHEEYYAQISQVVGTGNGAGACLPGERALTTVMFENLFTGKLWHAESVFDGYAPKANTLDRMTFGSLSLGPGAHEVKFTVQGKNPQATGQRIRVDQICGGVAGWPLEAELCEADGASSAPRFVGVGMSGGAYGMVSDTSANGDSVTYKVLNDAIDECEFIGKGRNVTLSNTVVRFDATYQPAGFPDGAFVSKLDGQYGAAWQGGQQTGDGVRSLYFLPTNCVIRIPVLAQWVTLDGFGPVFRFYKSLYNGGVEIHSPMFAIVEGAGVGGVSPDVPADRQIPLVFYQDGAEKPNWASCVNQRYLELRPRRAVRIDVGSTLIVSFRVSVASYGVDRMTAFDMKRTGIPGCWIIPGSDTNLVRQTVWSTHPDIQMVPRLPTLEAMAVGFADEGDYVSHPFDTRSAGGASKTFSWEADVPSGAALRMYARSGNVLAPDGFGIADAPEWESVGPAANGGVIMGGSGRYLQFRTVLKSTPFSAFPGESGASGAGPFRNATPRLRRALITWDGEPKYVDIVANILKSPDNGMFKVEVDGKPLFRGVTMEIEIFKDVLTQGGVKKERMRSAMMAEVEPRNSTKK